MHARFHSAHLALVPLLLFAGLPCRAQGPAGIDPANEATASPAVDDAETDDELGSIAARLGVVALGGALGAVGGFSLGAAIAGGAYPLLRREPPVAEGLAVGIGTPVALTLAGAGVGALLSPMVLGDPPSLAGGVGATGGAAVVGVAAAVPGAWLTWEATKSLGAAFDQPSPEGCILSLVGLSAALSVMFGGFCVGATSGGAAGGAAGAMLDVPDEVSPAAPPTEATPASGVPY